MHLTQNEVVFLGVASSATDGFPLAIGLGFPESKLTETVYIYPPKDWGLLDDIKEQKNDEPSDTKRKNKVIGGIQAIDLIAKGLAPDKAAELLFERVDGKAIYSVFPKEDRPLLEKLGIPIPTQVKIQSAITLFDSFVPSERERDLQLRTKMDLRYYPRNKSDTRWMIELLHRCQSSAYRETF